VIGYPGESEPRVANPDRLVQLFRAYRDQNDTSFRRAAEAIISEEVMANHHGLASELLKALGPTPNGGGRPNSLRPLHIDRGASESLLSFPRITPEEMRVVFCPDTERQVARVLEEYRQRLKLAEHGYRPKVRLLLWGPPGCGKTLTARYLAQQLGLRLGVVRLSATISMYLGETAARVQQAFDAAAETPMVLFFDEFDTVAKDRDDGNDVGELKRVVNSLLQALDGFEDARSLLVAASNHQYLLDDAAWRRFDAIIRFPLPGPGERAAFMARLLNGVNFSGSLAAAVKASEGLSFADVERSVTEAVKTMILAGRSEIKAGDVAAEVKALKSSLTEARRINPRSAREP
jgi:SpoVK/Ycf46/Vps4 family AAA+-type ATPase